MVVFKVESFLYELQSSFVGKTVSEQDKFLAASIVELNKLFQSAVLLYERGLPESASLNEEMLQLKKEILRILAKNKSILKTLIASRLNFKAGVFIRLLEDSTSENILCKKTLNLARTTLTIRDRKVIILIEIMRTRKNKTHNFSTVFLG